MTKYDPFEERRSARPIWLGEDLRTWDHVRIHVQLLKDPRLKANHLAVYMGLAVHAETASGKCHPSAATLGSYCDLRERQVRRLIADLEAWEYIAIKHSSGRANEYALLPPPTLVTHDRGGDKVIHTPVTHDHHPGHPRPGYPGHPRPGTPVTHDRITRTKEQEPFNENQELRETKICKRCLGDKFTFDEHDIAVQCVCQTSLVPPRLR